MEHIVNIKDFMKKFKDEYNFLYDHNNKVAGYREAIEAFDEMVNRNDSFKKFVSEFANYRGDFISSDREAAAFMFTMESMELL